MLRVSVSFTLFSLVFLVLPGLNPFFFVFGVPGNMLFRPVATTGPRSVLGSSRAKKVVFRDQF